MTFSANGAIWEAYVYADRNSFGFLGFGAAKIGLTHGVGSVASSMMSFSSNRFNSAGNFILQIKRNSFLSQRGLWYIGVNVERYFDVAHLSNALEKVLILYFYSTGLGRLGCR